MNFVMIMSKPKYGVKAKLCYMDGFIIYIKADNIYKDIEDLYKDPETRFDTSSYELDRPFPKGKNESCWINER